MIINKKRCNCRQAGNRVVTLVILASILMLANISQADQLTDLKRALSNTLSTRIAPLGSTQAPDQIVKNTPKFTIKAAEDTAAVNSLVRTYFPMFQGKTNRYLAPPVVDADNITYTYSVVQYQGQNMYMETDSMDGSNAFYGYSDSTLYLHGFSINNVQMDIEMELSFDRPTAILTDEALSTLGSVESNTSLTMDGERINLLITSKADMIGQVTVPAGNFSDCISISMEFLFTSRDQSESMTLKEAWILAPEIGKVKIATMDQNMNLIGWSDLMEATPGTGEMVETPVTEPESGQGSGGSSGCFIGVQLVH